MKRVRRALAAAVLIVTTSASASQDDELVTPVRVGNADAATTLAVWAQQDYSHLAALRPIADAFHVVLADWARAHPDVKLDVSNDGGLCPSSAILRSGPDGGGGQRLNHPQCPRPRLSTFT